MNTFWLKIAGLVLVVLAIIILVNVFSPSKDEPETKPKTFYDVIAEDDRRLRAEPETEQKPVTERTTQAEQAVEPAKPQFKELSEIERIEAERLFEFALNQRKIGRLPVTSFKPMVDACRQIIERWPDSVYAFKARRMLRDIPQRYRERYKITDEEMGISK